MSARCPAISARRSRRMSSSLFPLNIGPQTTSSQPPRSGSRRIMWGTLVSGLDGLLERPTCEEAQADDAERAAVLHHRQVPEVVVEHDLRRFLDRRLGADRERVGGHPLADARLGGTRAGGDRAQ